MTKKENSLLLSGFLFILVMYLPFLISGEGSYVRIHDNLDSEFIYLHLLKISENLFGFDSTTLVPNILNGLPRGYFHSEFSFIRVLFYIFPSFWAYVVNSFLVRIIGFFGIFILGRDYFQALNRPIVLFIIASAFSALPIYSLYGISVMGQPLLLWAFLNLMENNKPGLSFLVIILFPAYAHFAMTAPFILSALFLYGLHRNYFRQKRFTPIFWSGVGVLLISYIGFNFLTIKSFLFANELSHRAGMISHSPDFFAVIDLIINTAIYGQYHSAKFISIPIIALLGYSMWVKNPYAKKAFVVMGLIVAIAFFNGLYEFVAYYFGGTIHLLTSFNFDRFTFLIPFFYFLIPLILINGAKIKKSVIYALISLQLVLILYGNREFNKNVDKLISWKTESITSFRSFYSENLFDEIENFIQIPKKDFRVVSIGMHPSIAQYNGYYTLDSYQNNYPLLYKGQFREIIAKELNKSKKLKSYFDNWGSRLYIFSAELRESCFLQCKKNSTVEIDDLSLNTDKLKAMGAKYVFSAVPILNAEELNLKRKKVFKNDISEWKIYLYRIL